MSRVQIQVLGLEFEEDGNTIWVHGPEGTVLRIKCSGKISVTQCSNVCPHSDVQVQGDITFCVPNELDEEGSYVH